jgi:methyl-accepting chemotaxis protein
MSIATMPERIGSLRARISALKSEFNQAKGIVEANPLGMAGANEVENFLQALDTSLDHFKANITERTAALEHQFAATVEAIASLASEMDGAVKHISELALQSESDFTDQLKNPIEHGAADLSQGVQHHAQSFGHLIDEKTHACAEEIDKMSQAFKTGTSELKSEVTNSLDRLSHTVEDATRQVQTIIQSLETAHQVTQTASDGLSTGLNAVADVIRRLIHIFQEVTE